MKTLYENTGNQSPELFFLSVADRIFNLSLANA